MCKKKDAHTENTLTELFFDTSAFPKRPARLFFLCAAYLLLRKALGRLVLLGFGVAAFTPAAYQRHRL